MKFMGLIVRKLLYYIGIQLTVDRP